MQPHVHHAGLLRAFRVKHVEFLDQHVAEFVGRMTAPGEQGEVVDFV